MIVRTLFRRSACVSALLAMVAIPASAASPSSDPFLWLEDVHGARATAWVAQENVKTRAVLAADPRYAGFASDALRIIEAKDKLPSPDIIHGDVYDFRKDADHVRGYWRSATLASFESRTPAWKTVLDLDALSASEHANWAWAGANCDSKSETRCLISLSDGGEDAHTIREFDLKTDAFVPGGFVFPHGKQTAAWESEDSVLLSREWEPGQLTTSGYPYVIKRVRRGESLSDAKEIARGTSADVSEVPFETQDADGRRVVFVSRGLDFFNSDTSLVRGNDVALLAFPKKSSVAGLLDGRLVLKIDESWTPATTTFAAGSVVSVDLAALQADPAHPVVTLVTAPDATGAILTVGVTKFSLVVASLENVRGRVTVFTPKPDGTWSAMPVAVPDDATISLDTVDDRGATALFDVASFLIPTTLWTLDSSSAIAVQIQATPARFDASQDVVEQREAISKDGTHVPYFLVHRKTLPLDGSTPTILTAYGGFNVSETPSYSGVRGKLWLERGGAFALANIRGGGEFGPAWHEAGLKTHRQRIYDDFAAVAHDLIDRRVTSPSHLGIQGGSNGGLLMGVEFTQHPELYAAVDIQVPLLDMLRYEQLAAGSSWVGEYGSVSVPVERAFLARISPYANLRAGERYPKPFIWTTTKDDRVGPQQARKFAAELDALHDPYLFFEQTEGGHGSGVTAKENADINAMEFVYFSQQLMP